MLEIAFIKPGTGLGRVIEGGDVERNGCVSGALSDTVDIIE